MNKSTSAPMQRYLAQFAAVLVFVAITAGCQRQAVVQQPVTADRVDPGMLVEASCGQCQFELSGSGCDLAVRIDGKAYYVDGTAIDEHGDAHAADGFCNTVRRARVNGRVEDGRFVATSFELLVNENK